MQDWQVSYSEYRTLSTVNVIIYLRYLFIVINNRIKRIIYKY